MSSKLYFSVVVFSHVWKNMQEPYTNTRNLYDTSNYTCKLLQIHICVSINKSPSIDRPLWMFYGHASHKHSDKKQPEQQPPLPRWTSVQNPKLVIASSRLSSSCPLFIAIKETFPSSQTIRAWHLPLLYYNTKDLEALAVLGRCQGTGGKGCVEEGEGEDLGGGVWGRVSGGKEGLGDMGCWGRRERVVGRGVGEGKITEDRKRGEVGWRIVGQSV